MNTNKIEELRKLKNLTQKQLAEKINITITGYNNLIKRNDLKVSVLENIAKVLGVPVSYFFENEQKGNKNYNKEFDNFLNEYILENDTILNKLSSLLGTILERVECGFNNKSSHKIKFDYSLLQSIEVLAKSRNEFLFKNNSKINSFEVLLKSFRDIETEQKKEYFIHILEKNKELAELNNKLFEEFLKMLHSKNNDYFEDSTEEARKAFNKRYFGL